MQRLYGAPSRPIGERGSPEAARPLGPGDPRVGGFPTKPDRVDVPVRRYVFSPAKFEGGVMCGRGLRCKGKIGEAVRPVQSCVRPFSAVLDDRWP